MPPYLAGRDDERLEFQKLLSQKTITENAILTGLRGLGKTVLLETFKPMAIQYGWLWAGTDLSESTSISEENLAIRRLTDLSVVTSSIVIGYEEKQSIGLIPATTKSPLALNYTTLRGIYDEIPGLALSLAGGFGVQPAPIIMFGVCLDVKWRIRRRLGVAT